MIRPIITEKKQLAIQSEAIYSWAKTKIIIEDLIDTAKHYQTKPIGCVGLAANQIGCLSRIIVVWHEGRWLPMINPVVDPIPGKLSNQHEGCLSRPTVRTKVKRHKKIRVTYMNQEEETYQKKYTGFIARVIQHEVDHLNGIYI